jgi:23S rRNA (uracil1939-C5)-methyltransferase
MLKRNDIVNILITDLTIEGAGIGRFQDLAIFVQGALPGENVTVKIIKTAKNYAVGRLESINHETCYRRTPFCGVFGKCGGCTLQHLEYDQQLLFKQRHIRSCFSRIGGIDIPDPDVLGSGDTVAYRNKASFPVANIDGMVSAGFYAPRSHRVVPAHCPIQQPPLGAIKDAVVSWANSRGIGAYDETSQTGILRHIVGRRTSAGEAMAGLVLYRDTDVSTLIPALKHIDGLTNIVVNINDKNTNAILGENSQMVYGDGYITETYGSLSFRAGLHSAIASPV